MRKQLVTVPSCDMHNITKSQDDEYLLYALSMNINNNETAANHFKTKIMRAIKRRPSLMEKFARKQVPVKVVDTQTGEVHETLGLQVDKRRIESALVKIGYGLYFHHFKERWRGTVSVYPHFLLTGSSAAVLNQPMEQMAELTEEAFVNVTRRGENSDVFSFQTAAGPSAVEAIMYLRFYQGSRVTLFFRPLPIGEPQSPLPHTIEQTKT